MRFSDAPTPDLAEKITAMHLKKVATYPEWGRLLSTIPDVQVS